MDESQTDPGCRWQYDERTGMYWDLGTGEREQLPQYLPPLTGDHLLNMSAEDTPDETS
jgi:hypothetical protein